MARRQARGAAARSAAPEPPQASGDPPIDDANPADDGDGGDGATAAPQETELERQLRADLQETRERLARLEGAATERQQEPPPPPPKEWTRAELRQAVDAGTIDEDKMWEILAAQERRKTKDEILAEVETRVSATQSQSRIQTDIERYTERMPDLLDKRGPNWDRVVREHQYLRSIGAPEGAATELAALRSAFGPPERIPERTRAARDRQEDMLGAGGGDEGSGDGSRRGRGWTKGLDARQIEHYQKRLDVGAYSGTDDPRFVREIAIARGEDPRKVIERTRPKPTAAQRGVALQ